MSVATKDQSMLQRRRGRCLKDVQANAGTLVVDQGFTVFDRSIEPNFAELVLHCWVGHKRIHGARREENSIEHRERMAKFRRGMNRLVLDRDRFERNGLVGHGSGSVSGRRLVSSAKVKIRADWVDQRSQ
jgi:hypothetical protein